MYLSYTQKTGNKEVGPLLENRPYIYIYIYIMGHATEIGTSGSHKCQNA